MVVMAAMRVLTKVVGAGGVTARNTAARRRGLTTGTVAADLEGGPRMRALTTAGIALAIAMSLMTVIEMDAVDLVERRAPLIRDLTGTATNEAKATHLRKGTIAGVRIEAVQRRNDQEDVEIEAGTLTAMQRREGGQEDVEIEAGTLTAMQRREGGKVEVIGGEIAVCQKKGVRAGIAGITAEITALKSDRATGTATGSAARTAGMMTGQTNAAIIVTGESAVQKNESASITASTPALTVGDDSDLSRHRRRQRSFAESGEGGKGAEQDRSKRRCTNLPTFVLHRPRA